MTHHEGFRDHPEIPRFGADDPPEAEPQDPPEYAPDEEPGEDFPGETQEESDAREFERERQEYEYTRLLYETQQALSQVNRKLHEYMMAHRGDADDWQKLYILTGHIHALCNTITLYSRLAAPPF
jgi:hypothetical protein